MNELVPKWELGVEQPARKAGSSLRSERQFLLGGKRRNEWEQKRRTGVSVPYELSHGSRDLRPFAYDPCFSKTISAFLAANFSLR